MNHATIDDFDMVWKVFQDNKEWFPHVWNTKVKKRLINNELIFQDGVVITYSKSKRNGKIGRDTDVSITKGDYVIHQIINSNPRNGNAEKVIREYGKIDVLINNAGVTKDNIIMRMSNEDWNNVIETNLKGTFLGCKYVSKIMVKQKYGKIINISSIVGQIGNKGQTNYVASKAGIDGITKSLSKELGSRGININSIAPGYIETNMTKLLNDNIKKELLDKISLNRFGQPIEVANLAYFLITEEASYINGQIINLDGGM